MFDNDDDGSNSFEGMDHTAETNTKLRRTGFGKIGVKNARRLTVSERMRRNNSMFAGLWGKSTSYQLLQSLNQQNFVTVYNTQGQALFDVHPDQAEQQYGIRAKDALAMGGIVFCATAGAMTFDKWKNNLPVISQGNLGYRSLAADIDKGHGQLSGEKADTTLRMGTLIDDPNGYHVSYGPGLPRSRNDDEKLELKEAS